MPSPDLKKPNQKKKFTPDCSCCSRRRDAAWPPHCERNDWVRAVRARDVDSTTDGRLGSPVMGTSSKIQLINQLAHF